MLLRSRHPPPHRSTDSATTDDRSRFTEEQNIGILRAPGPASSSSPTLGDSTRIRWGRLLARIYLWIRPCDPSTYVIAVPPLRIVSYPE